MSRRPSEARNVSRFCLRVVWALGGVEGLFDLPDAIVMGSLLGEFNHGRCGGQGLQIRRGMLAKLLVAYPDPMRLIG
jgi:hypothetical protein